MSKIYTSAVVIIPPANIWDPIQEIRKIYDRQIDRWMPHINLMYPFRPKNQFITLKKKFLEMCIHINSFEVTLKNFKYFKHRNNNFTIWLNPIPNHLIIHLQSVILKILPDCNDVNKHKNGFQPHLSVGQIQ
ncbi:MAG: 2'-5' RNA ligase family protein, partial [Promethearchaeota archaeon]